MVKFTVSIKSSGNLKNFSLFCLISRQSPVSFLEESRKTLV